MSANKLSDVPIRRTYRGSTTNGIGHSFVFTKLCHRAGVEVGQDEELAPPRAIIDRFVIANF